MAELVTKAQTSLPGEEVIVRAVQFFTTEKWRCQTQSARAATFAGRPPIPVGLIILTIIGYVACIIPGVILYILVIRRMMRLQNIVVTANSIDVGSEVVITYPEHAKRMVSAFLSALPAVKASS